MSDLFDELQFSDLKILTQLRDETTLRSVARNLNQEPAAVSKRIKRLEELLGYEIIKRSPRGFIFTDEGNKLVIKANDILKSTEQLLGFRPDKFSSEKVLSIGSRGFLNVLLTGPLLAALSEFNLKTRLRFVDMPPLDTQRAGLAGLLDIAVHCEPMEWTPSWLSTQAASLKWNLFARKDHPLSRNVTLAQVLSHAFVSPCSWSGERLIAGEDGFPVPLRNRIKGHEVQTAFHALRIIRSTDQLAFLPTLLAEDAVASGEIRAIEPIDLPEVRRVIYLSVHLDRVSERERLTLLSAIKSLFEAVPVNLAKRPKLKQPEL